MSKSFRLTAVVLTLLTLSLLPLGTASSARTHDAVRSANGRSFAPVLQTTTVTNWSGYVANLAYTYTLVQGDWTVPSAPNQASDAAAWVGFNGFGNNAPGDCSAFAQTGTDSSWTDGYYAWIQIYDSCNPQQGPVVNLDLFSVNAGDHIHGAVNSWGANVVDFYIVDFTTGAKKNYRYYEPHGYFHEFSAEWVVEASPAYFSTVTFTNCHLTHAGTVYPINYYHNTYTVLHPPYIAVSGLDGTGTSFTETYV